MWWNLEHVSKLFVETIDGWDPSAVWELAIRTGLASFDESRVWLARSRRLKLRIRANEEMKRYPDVGHPMQSL